METRVFLILGQQCNLHCSYCFRREEKEKKEPSATLLNWLKSLPHPLTINFYGGEPMLYFESIKKVVSELGKKPNIRYDTMSNGTLIDGEKVAYINDNGIEVNLSWDGRNVAKTRGVDVLQTNRDNILQIKKLWINASLSPEAYPLQICEDFNVFAKEYYKIHEYYPNLHIGLVSPANKNLDLDKVRQEMREVYSCITNNSDNIGMRSLAIALERDVMCFLFGREKLDVYDVDVEGNFYLCPLRQDSRFLSVAEVEQYNKVKKPPIPQKCNACKLLKFCHGGCKYERDNGCELRKAFYEPIFDVLKLGGTNE